MCQLQGINSHLVSSQVSVMQLIIVVVANAIPRATMGIILT